MSAPSWSPLVARWRSGNAWLQDSVLAVGLVAVAFAPPLAADGVGLGELRHRPLGMAAVLTAAPALPLAARRPGQAERAVVGPRAGPRSPSR